MSKLAVEPLLDVIAPAAVLLVGTRRDGWTASLDGACRRRGIPVRPVDTLVDERVDGRVDDGGHGPMAALATVLVAMSADSVAAAVREVGVLFGRHVVHVTTESLMILHLPEPQDVSTELLQAGGATVSIRVDRLTADDWLVARPEVLRGYPSLAELLETLPSDAVSRTAPSIASTGPSPRSEDAPAAVGETMRIGAELEECRSARRVAEVRAAELESRLDALERRHGQLLRRRSVRLALGVAAAARGPVRFVRRRRSRPRRLGSASGPAPTTAGADDVVARLLESSELPPAVLVIVPPTGDSEELRGVVGSLACCLGSQDRVVLAVAALSRPSVRDLLREIGGDPRFEVVDQTDDHGWLDVVRDRVSNTDVDVVILRTSGGPRSIRWLQYAAYAAPRLAGASSQADAAVGDLYLRRAALEDVDGLVWLRASSLEDLLDAVRTRTAKLGWSWSTDSPHGVDAWAGGAAVAVSGEPVEPFAPASARHGPRPGAGGALRSATRVLSVIHDGGGGTEHTNLDLMRALVPDYEAWVLRSRIGSMLVERASDLAVEWSHPIYPGWRITDLERPDLRQLYTQVLRSWDIDLLHVRHLIGHTFDLPVVARALRIPVVLSLHDYYLACPTIHLLDERGTFCGGSCTPTPGPCRVPTTKLEGHPPLKHAWVHTWRQHVARTLRFVDAIVTTTPTVVEVFRTSFPDVKLPPIEVIEHGRDFPARVDAAVAPVPGEPLRVLVLGNTNRNKGGELLAQIALRAPELEFHFLGPVAPEYRELGVLHGAYRRDRVLDEIARVRPHVAAILSPWAETYSHALSEAWAAGVPVVASQLGAPGDRISEQGGGWLVDTSDVDAVRLRFLAISEGRADWPRRHAEALSADIRSVASMAAAYRSVYERVLSNVAPSSVQAR